MDLGAQCCDAGKMFLLNAPCRGLPKSLEKGLGLCFHESSCCCHSRLVRLSTQGLGAKAATKVSKPCQILLALLGFNII